MRGFNLAEFFGVMVGDGCLSNTGKGPGSGKKYWIYICGHKLDDRIHYNYLKKLIKILFNKEVKIQERNKQEAIFIRFSDKNIFNTLVNLGFPVGKKYSLLKVPFWILNDGYNSIEFLRGLFDTDGSFILSKQHKKFYYYPRIEITTKSYILAKQIKHLVNNLGINCSLNKKREYFRLEIAGNKNCASWMEIIGTNNEKHFIKYIYSLKL